jgi:hypothetical protein
VDSIKINGNIGLTVILLTGDIATSGNSTIKGKQSICVQPSQQNILIIMEESFLLEILLNLRGYLKVNGTISAGGWVVLIGMLLLKK